jgi:Zn-dependent protease with chaperone function
MPPPISPQEASKIFALIHDSPQTIAHTMLVSEISIVFALLSPLFAVIFLRIGGARELSARLAAKTKYLFIASFLFWAAYQTMRDLVFFPLSYYSSYIIPHRFGLSTMSLFEWGKEYLEDGALYMAIGGIIAGILICSIRRFPKKWPILFAAILNPIFNRFTPMPASNPLRPKIEALLQKAHVGSAEIYIVDKSKQTRATNAYVTGLGSSKRIVVWDTLLTKMPPDEILTVLSHEIGHYAEGHILIGFALSIAALFFGLPFVKRFAEKLIDRFGKSWGVSSLSDPGAMPVILLSFTLLSLVFTPVSNAASREIEHRADRYAIHLSGNRIALAKSFIALSEDNLWAASPPAWIKLMEDHPSLEDRVRFALEGD